MSGSKVSEASRERETFKYDSVLVANSIHNDVENLIPPSSLRSCSDPAMTALAQVAMLKLGASRAMVSLFDCQHQYIIAEATPSLRISAHASPPTSGSDSLWLCGTAIPRGFGICDNVLVNSEHDDLGQASLSSELPIKVISDLSTHDKFRHTWYYQQRPEHRFYAAVPIRTRRGINIGVFCILDNKPRESLDETSIQVMRDASWSILGQLELSRSGGGRRPGERMVRGLGSYVEGKTTMSGWQSSFAHDFDPDTKTEEGSLNKKQQNLQAQQEHAEDVADGQQSPDADTFVLESPYLNRPSSSFNSQNKTPQPVDTEEESRQQQLHKIFSKAANILRESIEVEGVVFLDASIGSFAGRVRSGSVRRESQTQGRSSSSSSSSSSSIDRDHVSISSPRGSGDSQVKGAICPVLGFSTSMSSSINGEPPSARSRNVPERQLQKLLRRYPKGKIFNFDSQGVMASSDTTSEDSAMATFQARKAQDLQEEQNGTTRKSRKAKDPYSQRNEGLAIRDLFPGARSVAFLPLWDSHRQRWFSGCFVYTMTPTRIFTVRGELSFLTAFNTVIMADVIMMESSIVSMATTSLLSSLSHELRSPLHGIVLCAELLRDTSLDVFQGDLLRSLDVCGRTLLDTINHLLDWTGINNFVKGPHEQKSNSGHDPGRGSQSGRKRSPLDGMLRLTSNVDVDMLVEDVVECIHAGYTYQQQSALLVRSHNSGEDHNRDPYVRLDGMDTADDIAVGKKTISNVGPGTVFVILDIDPAVDWAFHVESGALRRIIMNLCGNSLKYTNDGFVKIVAYQDPPNQGRPRERVVHIDIIDTGAGIGQDYLTHRAFTPFTQENVHASGAGLGLSLVRKFVRALGGSIQIQSKLGKGTRVAVKLPLQVASLESTETASDRDEFDSQAIELSGLRVCISGFSSSGSSSANQRWAPGEFDEHSFLEKVCRNWLKMQIVGSFNNNDFLPDLILCDEYHLESIANQPRDELSSPVVVVCRSAAVARQLDQSHRSLRKVNWGLFSFISRPVGPRKLAKAFVLCFRRWTKLQATAADRASVSTILDLPTSEPQLAQGRPNVKNDGYFDLAPPLSPQKKRARSDDDDAQTPLPGGSAVRSTPPTQPQKSRFLLVEDNAINMKILQTYMKKLGLGYDTASNGLLALESYKAQEGCYKCILMDISMPVMDGFEATRLIRGFEKDSHLPRSQILAISGLASKDAQEDAFANGLDLFLSKPVQLKELSRILKNRKLI
ncbi:related to nik-1 protein (Os-1p protein) [Fusarium torulosum]|uniref:Related to nik-1 protein (Os-1p protein) n=1 Tax=Fusarium torulosum TaxID=33205 RepID=A0AAE8ME52_9HYPO|nr:related to nik-1 protein (Os-1p protein) [Fusarium torulosum]